MIRSLTALLAVASFCSVGSAAVVTIADFESGLGSNFTVNNGTTLTTPGLESSAGAISRVTAPGSGNFQEIGRVDLAPFIANVDLNNPFVQFTASFQDDGSFDAGDFAKIDVVSNGSFSFLNTVNNDLQNSIGTEFVIQADLTSDLAALQDPNSPSQVVFYLSTSNENGVANVTGTYTIDNVGINTTATAVPEPASMLALGVIGTAAAVRRRRRNG